MENYSAVYIESESKRQSIRAGSEVNKLNELDDKEIVALFFERNEKAIAAASEKYGKYISSVAMNVLRNREDAEECVNDALLRVWERIPPESPSNFPGFLAKITKNLSINKYNMLRSGKRGSGEIPLIFDELSECIASGGSVEKSYEQKELLSAVNGFLEKLPSKKRDIFVLRYWYCLSVSEVASRVGISENNAAVTLSRLRARLTEHLRKRGF